MSLNTHLTLSKPSEFYDAVISGLRTSIGGGVEILPYASFNSQTVSGLEIYVEVDGFNPVSLFSDGRHSQLLEVTIHCIVSRAIENADLQALDLASAVSRVVQTNCWGLGETVDFPEHISGSAGMLATGENAFEGWAVSFHQTVYLGDVPFEPTVINVNLAVNPDDESDAGEYERVGNA
ncbi:hypothetical protein ACRN9E_20060 [Shewanella frigidimarina]